MALDKSAPTRDYGGETGEQRAARRRDALLDAAFAALADSGRDGVRIEILCRTAGLNKRYFYESFRDADAIVTAVLEHLAQAAADAAVATIDADPAADAAVAATNADPAADAAPVAVTNADPTADAAAVAATDADPAAAPLDPRPAAEAARGPGSDAARARRAVTAFVAHLTDDPRRARVLFGAVAVGDAAAQSRTAALRTVVRVVADEGGRIYGLRAGQRVDVAAAMLVGGTGQAILDWLDGRVGGSRDDLTEELVALWLTVADTTSARVRADDR